MFALRVALVMIIGAAVGGWLAYSRTSPAKNEQAFGKPPAASTQEVADEKDPAIAAYNRSVRGADVATGAGDIDPSMAAAASIGSSLAKSGFSGTSKGLSAKRPSMKYLNGKLIEDNTPPVIQVDSEFGGPEHGVWTVPSFLGDVVYMSVTLQTEGGSPLAGKKVALSDSAGNRFVLMADATDAQGYIELHVLASHRGRDTFTVESAGVQLKFVLDVTDPPRNDWLGPLDLKGTTSWELLLEADVHMERAEVEASFPAPLQSLNDQSIKLAGFMLPLESSAKQKHFLLSANPPSCFFHPPGGPASVIEVFTDKGVDMTFDPMVVEGTFQLLPKSPNGILYRMQGARVTAKG